MERTQRSTWGWVLVLLMRKSKHQVQDYKPVQVYKPLQITCETLRTGPDLNAKEIIHKSVWEKQEKALLNGQHNTASK